VALTGAFPLPYVYYSFLRIIVCSWAIWAISNTWKTEKGTVRWFLVGLALLFNPIHPLHFTKPVWACTDLATAAALLWYSYRSTTK
jgi:hypothetical protein